MGPVYRSFDLDSLNRQYDNRGKVTREALEAYRGEWALGSDLARTSFDCALDIQYGATIDEKLDVFKPAAVGPHPVQVYIHGGYWHFGDKRECAYVALGLCANSMVTVVINYGLAPLVSVAQQVEQTVNAIKWVAKNIARYDGDPSSVYVVGHSAGAHLALMTVAREFGARDARLSSGLVKGVCALSGVYDLEPIIRTSMNERIRLIDHEIEALSPARLDCDGDVIALVGVGSLEGEEFIRQTDVLVNRWSQKSSNVRAKIYEGDDHFSIRTGLGHPQSEVCRDIQGLMGRIIEE